jgi:hypothetical protein
MNLLQRMRMAAEPLPVTAATSLQDSELPYRSIMACLTSGGASRRIFSASTTASAIENGVSEEDS